MNVGTATTIGKRRFILLSSPYLAIRAGLTPRKMPLSPQWVHKVPVMQATKKQ